MKFYFILMLCLTTSAAFAQMGTPAVSLTSNGTGYIFQYSFSGSSSNHQIYIDVNNASSGFSVSSIGAEYLIENGNLYQFTGSSQSSWSWSSLGSVNFSKKNGLAKWSNILKTKIASPASFKFISKRYTPSLASAVINSPGLTPVPDPTPVPVDSLTTIAPLSSSAEFSNPERGFSKYANFESFSQSSANSIASAGFRLSGIQVTIPSATQVLPAAFINSYNAMFTYARTAGIKLIITHRYHDIHDFASDPSQAFILSHIDQIFPLIATNKDVVLNTHVSMIGAYGEMYYSQYGQNFTFIRDMTKKMLDYMPAGHHVSLRTPGMKVKSFSMTAPNVSSDPANATYMNRVGHWNDCFLAGSSDQGTNGNYSLPSPTDWRDYIGQEASANALPVGGETCQVVAPYSQCANALLQVKKQKWTYLNRDYNGAVYDSWILDGCYNEISQGLGYRLRLNEFKYKTVASYTVPLNIEMKIENLGFSAPIHGRPVKLVLFNATTNYQFDLSLNPSAWKTGIYSISKSLGISSVAAGTYSIALYMPDPSASIQNNVKYSLQLANQGSWDAVKGWNVIKNGADAIQIQITN
jgi:hypothetical protein